MQFRPQPTKWCHVTWTTARHRKCFKIAAQARFCEQALERECRRHGWTGIAALLPDRVHVLVEVPDTAPRVTVVARLRDLATQVVRDAGLAAWRERVWEPGGWCSVLTSASAVDAVKRYLRAQRAAVNTRGATSPP
jgi:REP element-mobilizing transposase RayT